MLNGGCQEICLPLENGRRCECDIGLKLQPDQSCDSGKHAYNIYHTVLHKCITPLGNCKYMYLESFQVNSL